MMEFKEVIKEFARRQHFKVEDRGNALLLEGRVFNKPLEMRNWRGLD